jgi:hypothetical protein
VGNVERLGIILVRVQGLEIGLDEESVQGNGGRSKRLGKRML